MRIGYTGNDVATSETNSYFEFDQSYGVNPVDESLPTPVVVRPALDQMVVPVDTLSILANTEIPVNDLTALAYRLNGRENIPTTFDPPQDFLQASAEDTFWVTNTDTNYSF